MSKFSLLRSAETTAHIISWVYLFSFPVFFFRNGPDFNWRHCVPQFATTATMCALFYFNYLYLIPLLMQKKEKAEYRTLIITGLCNAFVLATLLELFFNFPLRHFMPPTGDKPSHISFVRIGCLHIFIWGFVRNFMTLLATSGIAFTLYLSHRWHQSETERQQSETARAEAELRALRHQLSPHFLLNALNSIYSLVAFDGDKAQRTLVELSKMLRYQLYESNAPYVPLKKEVEFLQNYIALMQTRITENTRVNATFRIDDDNLIIAPNLLINIVENAFKHGVQPSCPSLIELCLTTHEGCLTFTCRNTIKKTILMPIDAGTAIPQADNATGLGLQQVKTLLQIHYPDRHEWTHGVSPDGKHYESVLTIRL